MDRFPHTHTKRFLSRDDADDMFTILYQELDRQQYDIMMFGKKMMQPRLVSFYADDGVSYRHAQTSLVGSGWNHHLHILKERIEEYTGYVFNSVLCNLYRNGNDSMGRHADDEPELGPDPVIASISLGEERYMHCKNLSGLCKTKLLLESGSLLVMEHSDQKTQKKEMMTYEREKSKEELSYGTGATRTCRAVSGFFDSSFFDKCVVDFASYTQTNGGLQPHKKKAQPTDAE